MIRTIEALHYRCLRYVRQPLDRFHVLVGPNASGKTTFLDVVAFLGRMVSDGLEAAILERTENFNDLLWGREGNCFELALEVDVPEDRRQLLRKKDYETFRYEVRIGIDPDRKEIGILEERGILKPTSNEPVQQYEVFPREVLAPATILMGKTRANWRTVFSKVGGNDHFYSEVEEESGKGWYPSVRLGAKKSTLANLHEDESRFPVSTWLKEMLEKGIQRFVLNSLLIRKASPFQVDSAFRPDGANLPWVVESLRKHKRRFRDWLEHVQLVLPDVSDVRTVLRKDDRARYLTIRYKGGLEVPSWMASDGTLRLLALTILPYLPEAQGIYLIEEPENGIHPAGAQAVFDSLSSVYQGQVLLATHSPVVLSVAEAKHVLCFKKTESGATDIVVGRDHPRLKDWKGSPNLGDLLAGGILG